MKMAKGGSKERRTTNLALVAAERIAVELQEAVDPGVSLKKLALAWIRMPRDGGAVRNLDNPPPP